MPTLQVTDTVITFPSCYNTVGHARVCVMTLTSPPSLPLSRLTGLTKNGHVPKGTCGLMDIQHPAVLDDHTVVSAQSQLSTCGDARP